MNLLPHVGKEQTKGRSPVCIRMCLVKSLRRENGFRQESSVQKWVAGDLALDFLPAFLVRRGKPDWGTACSRSWDTCCWPIEPVSSYWANWFMMLLNSWFDTPSIELGVSCSKALKFEEWLGPAMGSWSSACASFKEASSPLKYVSWPLKRLAVSGCEDSDSHIVRSLKVTLCSDTHQRFPQKRCCSAGCYFRSVCLLLKALLSCCVADLWRSDQRGVQEWVWSVVVYDVHPRLGSSLQFKIMSSSIIPKKIDLKPKREHGFSVVLFVLGSLFPPLGE